MNKKYLPKPKAYLADGGTIQKCASGESGVLPKIGRQRIIKAINEVGLKKIKVR